MTDFPELQYSDRLIRVHGTDPFEAGVAYGRALEDRLQPYIDRYFEARLSQKQNQPALPEPQAFRQASLAFLERLPDRFRQELSGLSHGAGLLVERMAEWVYLEEYLEQGCSGALCQIDGAVWVARNNDIFAPDLWGYAVIREIEDRHATLCFSLLGDVFAPTGVNRERLWLHYNYLPAWDSPSGSKPQMPPYAFIVEALETCSSLVELERLLNQVDRAGAMLLYAVDGKTNQFALYECTCREHIRIKPSMPWLAGTNHYCALPIPDQASRPDTRSQHRLNRIGELLHEFYAQPTPTLPEDLINILADDGVERRESQFATAYSCVACPEKGDIWYTFGGYPSASAGNWAKLSWPWQ